VGRGGKVEVYGTAEDEQGVVSAMTRQRRGWRGMAGSGRAVLVDAR